MVRSIFWLLLVTPLSFAFQGTKVGIVDADTVIQESKRGKAFLKELEAFSEEKRSELDGLGKEYETLGSNLKDRSASMSEAKRKETMAQMERLGTELQRKKEDAEREAGIKLRNGLEEIRNEMLPLIRQVAIEKNLDMVLNMGPQSQVVYFHDRIDITKDVIAKYDETVN